MMMIVIAELLFFLKQMQQHILIEIIRMDVRTEKKNVTIVNC